MSGGEPSSIKQPCRCAARQPVLSLTRVGVCRFCFDLKVMKHLNAFGSLDWGLSNIMDPDFDAVAFKMYPIYATFGVAYRY